MRENAVSVLEIFIRIIDMYYTDVSHSKSTDCSKIDQNIITGFSLPAVLRTLSRVSNIILISLKVTFMVLQ